MMKNSMRLTFQIQGLRTARPGAVLVLVLFFVALAGGLAVLMSGSASRLARTTRSQHETMLLRQLMESGKEWVRAHEEFAGEATTALDGSGILPDGLAGRITLTGDVATDRIRIQAELALPGGTATQLMGTSPVPK